MARPPALVTRLCASHEDGDCSLVALAMLTGRSYDEVRAVVRRHTRARSGDGLRVAQIQRVAARLGTPLRYVRTYEPEECYGIVLTTDHAAILRAGLVVECDGTNSVWEYADWLEARGHPVTGVLVPVEE